MNQLRLPLFHILRHPRAVEHLRAYALSEHSDENFTFIREVESFRELNRLPKDGDGNGKTQQQRIQDAGVAIWHKFKPGSDFAILWNQDTLSYVQQHMNLEAGIIRDCYAFNAAQKIEIENFCNDVLPRFYASKEYIRLTEDLLSELAVTLHDNIHMESLSRVRHSHSRSTSVNRAPERRGSVTHGINHSHLGVPGQHHQRTRSGSIGSTSTATLTAAAATAAHQQRPSSGTSTPTKRQANGKDSMASHRLSIFQMTLSKLQIKNDAPQGPGTGTGTGTGTASSGHLSPGAGSGTQSPATYQRMLSASTVPNGAILALENGHHTPDEKRLVDGCDELTMTATHDTIDHVLPIDDTTTDAYGGQHAMYEDEKAFEFDPEQHADEQVDEQFEQVELYQKGFLLFHANPLGVQLIRKFMLTEYSVDNYDFILAVQLFKSRCLDQDELILEAHRIYSVFLDEASKHEVTFPSEYRRAILTAFASPGTITPNIFDAIEATVMATVRKDIFPRFIKSSLFKHISAELRDRYNKLQKELDPEHTKQQHRARAASITHAGEIRNQKDKEKALALQQLGPSVDLEETVADQDYLNAFIGFCRKEHSEENILFWCASKQYGRMLSEKCSIEERDKMALEIYGKYVAPGSEFEIPISAHLKHHITRELNLLHPEIYLDAQNAVFEIMKTDAFPRFVKSAEYATIAKRKKSEKSSKLGFIFCR